MNLNERADALDEKLKANPIDASIRTLVRDAKRRQRQIIALTVSLILDVFLTIGFGYLAVQANDTAQSAAHSQAIIESNCRSGNEFRATEATLWNHILALQPIINNLTPEQQAARDKTVIDLQNYLKTTFALRDCSKL